MRRARAGRMASSSSTIATIPQLGLASASIIAHWQGEVHHGAAIFAAGRPDITPLGVDTVTADRQSHPHAPGLGSEKGIEHPFQMLGLDSRSGVSDVHANAVAFGLDRDID